MPVDKCDAQSIKDGEINHSLENWQGYGSQNIIDYVYELHRLSEEDIAAKYQYNLVIRTAITGWSPRIEYQITLRKKKPPRDGQPFDKTKGELIVIFEHPIDKSIAEQTRLLTERNPKWRPEEIAKEIKIKRDTLIVDNYSTYNALINEMDTINIPLRFPSYLLIGGPICQVYFQNMTIENYFTIPIGSYGNDYNPITNWILKLFRETILEYHAIHPKWYDKEGNPIDER